MTKIALACLAAQGVRRAGSPLELADKTSFGDVDVVAELPLTASDLCADASGDAGPPSADDRARARELMDRVRVALMAALGSPEPPANPSGPCVSFLSRERYQVIIPCTPSTDSVVRFVRHHDDITRRAPRSTSSGPRRASTR